MKIVILTTKAPHHIYYVNRLVKEFPDWDFKVIMETPIDFSSFKEGKKRVKMLWKKRDFMGLVLYFPYVKINLFQKKRREFERNFLGGENDFSREAVLIDNHNNSFPIVEEFKPDLVIVFGARPLKRDFLKKITCPIMNHHGAVLPYFRGLDADVWLAFYKKFEQVGCSIHFVVEKLDEGKIILARRLEIKPGMRIFEMRGRKAKLHTEMMIEILKDWEKAEKGAYSNETEKGIYRSFAPFWVEIIADLNLRMKH